MREHELRLGDHEQSPRELAIDMIRQRRQRLGQFQADEAAIEAGEPPGAGPIERGEDRAALDRARREF